jgi:hypothetical protein
LGRHRLGNAACVTRAGRGGDGQRGISSAGIRVPRDRTPWPARQYTSASRAARVSKSMSAACRASFRRQE